MATYGWESRPTDVNTLKTLLKGYDPYKTGFDVLAKNLTGDAIGNVGAQSLGSLSGTSSKYLETAKSYLAEQQKNLTAINPAFDPNKYLANSSAYVATTTGGGASANRKYGAVAPLTQAYDIMKAVEKAQYAADQYKTTGKIIDPTTAYLQEWKQFAGINRMDDASASKYVKNIKINQGDTKPYAYKDITINDWLKFAPTTTGAQSANAAALRAGVKTPFMGAGVGDIAEGGAITNATIASGVDPNKQVAKVQQGLAPITSQADISHAVAKSQSKYGGMAQSIIDQLNSGLTSNGSPLNAKQRQSLEQQFQSLTGLDTVPVSNGAPLRSNYADGPDGDKQFQAAVAATNTKLKAQNGQLPTSVLDAQNSSDANAILNQIAQNAFGDGTTGVPTRTDSTNPDLAAASGYFADILGGGTGVSNGGATSGTTSNAGANSGASDSGGAPVFSAENKLTQLRNQYGVDPMEHQIADIDAQIRAVQDTFDQNKFNEKGQVVSLGVMSGRISEEEQQANDRLNQLNRNKAYLVDQLQSKYSVIDTVMKAAQSDYQNARDSYDTQFNQKIQATNLLLNIDQSKKSDAEKARDDARANVTIVTTALSNGSLKWDDLDPASKAQYSKLEIQAGLPTGTIQAFSAQGKNNQWEMSTVLPGVDANGNAIATVLQKNKSTGEFKTTKLITDYAPTNKSAKSNVVQQGTFVDDKGNQIAWTKYADGTTEKENLGKAKQDTANMSQDEKDQNEFYKYTADLVEKMSLMPPNNIKPDNAVKVLRARYPWLTDSQARTELGV